MILRRISLEKIGRILIAACLSGSVFLQPVAAISNEMVSYLYEPYLAQDLDFQYVEITDVPAVPIENAGEVLQASSGGVSPVYAGCVGADISSGTFACSAFSETENVSENGEGVSFAKWCEVRIIMASYPAFFGGGDVNEDGRIDIYKGEWPSISDVTGKNTASYIMTAGGTVPGDEYHNQSSNFIPNSDPGYDNPEEAVMVEATVSATGENVQQSQSDPTELGVGKCSTDPTSTTALICDSPKKASEEWDTAFWSVPGLSQTRPISYESVCPLIDPVGGELACFNPIAAVASFGFSLTGLLSDIACRLTNTCYENVQLMVWTDTMFGKNEGCEEPCGDMHTDAMVAGQSIPVDGRTSEKEEKGQNSPLSTDKYVGTNGRCNVCGRTIPCTFVWKNWIYDEYQRMKFEQGPCDPYQCSVRDSQGRAITTESACHATGGDWREDDELDWFCTFEDSDYYDDGTGTLDMGYFTYVVQRSGGF